MANPLSSVLGWLRAGYPDGIPPQDFFPLLALLSHTLSPEQLDEVVATIIRENPEREITAEDVHAAIAAHTDSPAAPEDVRAVASRLAAAGWPLSGTPGDDAPKDADVDPSSARSDEGDQAGGDPHGNLDDEEDRPGITQRLVSWLVAGYPDGIPATDRVPLVALLRSRLSDEQIELLVARIIQERRPRPVDPDEVKALVARYTDEAPLPEDLQRVSAQLAAKGWPLSSDG